MKKVYLTLVLTLAVATLVHQQNKNSKRVNLANDSYQDTQRRGPANKNPFNKKQILAGHEDELSEQEEAISILQEELDKLAPAQEARKINDSYRHDYKIVEQKLIKNFKKNLSPTSKVEISNITRRQGKIHARIHLLSEDGHKSTFNGQFNESGTLLKTWNYPVYEVKQAGRFPASALIQEDSDY